MTFEKDLLEMGYTIRGNCTAPPSYPPVNITWSLNGKKVSGNGPLSHINIRRRRQQLRFLSSRRIDGNNGDQFITSTISLFNNNAVKHEGITDDEHKHIKLFGR
jgi:hypothetical protein